jgi:tripartite-type tricarboxylate transporter receptor subunit TctC
VPSNHQETGFVMKRIFAALAFLAIASGAGAQYPTRAIRLVVPFAAGGSTDLIARVVAEQLRKELGQPVVVENRGGAAGALGTEEVAKSTPDGYTLAVATVSTMIVYLASRDKPTYTLESFAPITNMASMPNVMTAGPSIPAKDLKEFIALAKANPGKYTYASSGIGSINHMLGESFQAYAGVKLVHVPYKGSGPAMQDVMGGQVDLLFDQFPSSKTYIDSGKLKGIGAISPQKIPGYPNVMTMEDAGMKGFNDEAWYGILAPAKTPPEIVAKLTEAARKALANRELRARIEQLGARPVGNSPAEFTAQMKGETERMRKLIRERNIKLEE